MEAERSLLAIAAAGSRIKNTGLMIAKHGGAGIVVCDSGH